MGNTINDVGSWLYGKVWRPVEHELFNYQENVDQFVGNVVDWSPADINISDRAAAVLTLFASASPFGCEQQEAETTLTSPCDPDGDGDITDAFVDHNFKKALREALEKGKSDEITVEDAFNTTQLTLSEKNINNLAGIECFTNLTELDLGGNYVPDSDLSLLAGLTNLKSLGLYSNQITDISPLEGLTNLYELWLMDNQISDISPLQGFTNLSELHLSDNLIQDIMALINNPGLAEGDSVTLAGNSQIPTSQIDALKAKGVDVFWNGW